MPLSVAGALWFTAPARVDRFTLVLAPALLATLVYRFFTLWLPIGVAALALTQVKALAEELPRVEHEPAPG